MYFKSVNTSGKFGSRAPGIEMCFNPPTPLRYRLKNAEKKDLPIQLLSDRLNPVAQ